MKTNIKPFIITALVLLCITTVEAQVKDQISKTTTAQNMKRVLIDRITVPANSKEDFVEKMNANRAIVKQQPGFIKDEVYVQQDEIGNFVFVTIATWESIAAITKAREAVQAEYNKNGFNLAAFCQKLNIKIDRGIYAPLSN